MCSILSHTHALTVDVRPTLPCCSFMAELHRQFEEAGGTTALYSRVVGGAVAGPLKRLVRSGAA